MAEVHGAEVDRHLPVPGLLAQLHRAADLQDADVVVQEIEAPEGLEAALDRAGHRRAVGDVGLKGLGLAPLAADDGDGLLRRLVHQIDAEDARPFPRE
jgi:hypothetical protein